MRAMRSSVVHHRPLYELKELASSTTRHLSKAGGVLESWKNWGWRVFGYVSRFLCRPG